MSLQPRTTYRTIGGDVVHIAGPARGSDLDGIRAWWSIRGDHYLDDGRMLSGRLLRNDDGTQRYERFALDATNSRSIDLTTADTKDPWWEGVNIAGRS